MDNPAAIYHVARDGQVIGAFAFPTLAEEFKVGSVLATDHYIIEGEADWKLVEELKAAFAKHEKELIRAEKERIKAEQERIKAEQKRQEAEKARIAAEERAYLAAEERRKDEEALRKVNEERALRIAEAEKARLEAERRRAIAWSCATCGKKFADPKRTGDGTSEIESSLMCLIGSMICGFVAWLLLKASFRIDLDSLRSRDSGDGAIIGFYVFLAATLVLAWGSARGLVVGGVAKGMDTYHGRKSCCPHCGSGNFSETKFD